MIFFHMLLKRQLQRLSHIKYILDGLRSHFIIEHL